MTIHLRNNMPSVCLETHGRIVLKPAMNIAINRNPVIVIKDNQFSKTQRASQGANFVRDTLHETAVANKTISIMIDYRESRTIKCRCHMSFSNCHADRIAKALA